MSNIITQTIEIPAPIDQVWKSIADHKEFGDWFGVQIATPFEPGKTTTGQMQYKGQTLVMSMHIERMESPSYFAYKWHPYALDISVDYSTEDPTLVEFKLEPHPVGTRLTVVESGFENVPETRRVEAFRMNTGGWQYQLKNVKEYAERHAPTKP